MYFLYSWAQTFVMESQAVIQMFHSEVKQLSATFLRWGEREEGLNKTSKKSHIKRDNRIEEVRSEELWWRTAHIITGSAAIHSAHTFDTMVNIVVIKTLIFLFYNQLINVLRQPLNIFTVLLQVILKVLYSSSKHII